MEMHERIRELRKNYLHMSQTEFGEKLGVSRSVIKNIELNALARPDQKLSLIKLMCKEFNISEDWLLNGIGEMFGEEEEEDEYFKYATLLSEDPLFISATIAYGKASPEIRKNLLNFFREVYNNLDQLEPEE